MKPARWSLTIARVAGIEIRLHASMLLLVWLAALMAQKDPGGLTGAFAWVVTIFVCVLVHEFAHSLVARHLGVHVREIELLPIGGLSKMERIPDNPRHEFAIAVAGPAASLALGTGLLAAVSAAHGHIPPPTLAGGAFVARTAWFNLVIGAFNLLPALPLDGGRILRAFFEQREGPLRATHHAARIARILAVGMILVGAIFNVFLMVIGLFVSVMSRSEEATAEVNARLHGVRVGDLMIQAPVVVAENARVGDVSAMLTTTSQRQFPVVSQRGVYVGMLDVGRLANMSDGALVSELVAPIVPTTASASVELPTLFADGATKPVVDSDGHVVGLIRADDVLFAVQHSIAAAQL